MKLKINKVNKAEKTRKIKRTAVCVVSLTFLLSIGLYFVNSYTSKFCYSGFKKDGVRIPDTNLCISLIDAISPNDKWYLAATPVLRNHLYGWGYFMGFEENCHNKSCGNVEQDTSWCKTVLGSNWRFPTTEEYITIFNNKESLNTVLSITDGATLSSVGYWTTDEYLTSNAIYFNMVSGSLGRDRNKTSYGITYLRCVRDSWLFVKLWGKLY